MPKISNKILNTPLVRKAFFSFPVRLSRKLVEYNHYRLAEIVVWPTNRLYSNSGQMLEITEHINLARKNEVVFRNTRAQSLRFKLDRAARHHNHLGCLKTMAALERLQRAGSLAGGEVIAREIGSESGRQRLLEAARAAQESHPESAYLLALIGTCEAMAGNHRSAGREVLQGLKILESNHDTLSRKRVEILTGAWRAIDMAARERMDWATDDAGYEQLLEPDKKESGEADASITGFKEQALQGRMRGEYLGACLREFETAKYLGSRLGHVNAMVREGVRQIADYTESYDLARECFGRLRDQWTLLASADPVDSPGRICSDLVLVLTLARKLGMENDAARAKADILAVTARPEFKTSLWPLVAALSQDETDSVMANHIADRLAGQPLRNDSDVRAYFKWALNTSHYEDANARFERLPARLRRAHGTLYYVNILQRQGRFAEAKQHVELIQAAVLSNPSRFKAYSCYSLIKRVGELGFLERTAKIWSSVPQPRRPERVIVIAARNLHLLTRYPLVVLMEMKRQGWAVVPLFEGLLPKEETGDPGLDVLNGCLTLNRRFHPAIKDRFPPVGSFEWDSGTGRLEIAGLDLSHAVWEDSAINRRRYSIDYQCPAIRNYSTGLAEQTRLVAMAVDHLHRHAAAHGLRVGLMSLFNHRLPDALFRFYCEKFGAPESFFYLHASNGYENYFKNFSTPISSRFVLRNMTASPIARSASFPLPENFESYYQTRRHTAAALLEKFEHVTKVKRSTAGNRGIPAGALDVDRRLAAWRQDGRHVACAFGKVPFDSGVPYDGGPVHDNMKDWLNHCIRAVRGSDTLLLIKPHPHEINNKIAAFPTQYFHELIEEDGGENVIMLGHNWFDLHDMKSRIELGVIYNGTTAIELGILGVPCILASHFAPVDYPIGHVTPRSCAEFERMLRFETPVAAAPDIRERAAVWLDYMSSDRFMLNYRYHARPITNLAVYPPWWEDDDVRAYFERGDPNVEELVGRATGARREPF